jgi:hypothetical protein
VIQNMRNVTGTANRLTAVPMPGPRVHPVKRPSMRMKREAWAGSENGRSGWVVLVEKSLMRPIRTDSTSSGGERPSRLTSSIHRSMGPSLMRVKP